jgi:hypothetical protein
MTETAFYRTTVPMTVPFAKRESSLKLLMRLLVPLVFLGAIYPTNRLALPCTIPAMTALRAKKASTTLKTVNQVALFAP